MQSLLKLLCYALLFFSVAQPAVIFPSLDRYRVFFILSALATVLFLVNRAGSPETKNKLPQNKLLLGILVTYTLSEAQFMWLSGTIGVLAFWLKKIILYFIIISVISDIKDLKLSMWAIVWATVIISIMGWDIFLNKPELLHDQSRLESVGNYNLSNSFALLVTVVFPLTFSLMEVERNPLKKMVLVAILILLVVSCVYTKSRGGNLGMMAAIISSIFFSRKMFTQKLFKMIVVGIMITTFLGFSVTVILKRHDVKGYIGTDSSAEDRLLAYEAAIRMFIDHPLFGVGWQKFNENVRNYGHDKKILAHNTPLSVLAETGPFGLFFFLAIIYQMIKQLWQMRKFWLLKEERLDLCILSQGVLISLCCFLINTSFSVKDHEPIYWAIIYLTGSLCVIFKKDTQATVQSTG